MWPRSFYSPVSAPFLPLARNCTSSLHIGTALSYICLYELVCIHFKPTVSLSKWTSIVLTTFLSLLITLTIAPLTRPADTSTLILLLTLYEHPPVSYRFFDNWFKSKCFVWPDTEWHASILYYAAEPLPFLIKRYALSSGGGRCLTLGGAFNGRA